MGWGTDFKANIKIKLKKVFSFTTNLFLSKINIDEIDDRIKELEDDIKGYEDKLKMFSSSNPKDIVPEDWKEQPIDYMHNEVSELIGMLKEDYRTLIDLYHYKNDIIGEPESD